MTGLAELGGSWTLNGGLVWRTGTLKGLSADQSRIVGNALWRQRRSRDFSVDDLSARFELAGQIGRHRVSAGVKGYRFFYGERWLRINPSAAVAYIGDRAGSLTANPVLLPEYVKVKAAIEAPLVEGVRFRLEADNLLDQRYAASSYSALWIYPGAPRTVRASLRLEI
nr:TonB-dependent receptor [Sphingomonas phyllosphaerae]